MTSCIRKVMEPRPSTRVTSSYRSTTPPPAGCCRNVWNPIESMRVGLLMQSWSSVLHCLITAAAASRATCIWLTKHLDEGIRDSKLRLTLVLYGVTQGGFTLVAQAVSDRSSGCAAPLPAVFGYNFHIGGLSGPPLHDRNANRPKHHVYPLADHGICAIGPR